MSDEQKLLAACGDYRAKLDKLEAENTALWENRARLWDECADWHEAYCSVGEALGVNEPEYSGRDFFAELVKELVAENAALRAKVEVIVKNYEDYKAENAALRVALEDIMTESDEQVIWRMARAALERKEAQP
jgi:cell division protein FtsB